MRAFAQSIVETVRHPLLVLDAELVVVKANPSFTRTFQIAEEQAEGCRLHEMCGGAWDIPRLQTLLQGVLPGGAFDVFEIEHDFPGVGRKVLRLDGRRVNHDDGSPMVLLTIEDVTDRMKIREELQRLNRELERRVQERTAELEASNRELEAFCYSVSHDLRAPLRALDGFSDELLRNYAGRILDEKGHHYLKRIRAGTQRMGQLIDDLLQLSRVSRTEMRRVRVDLTATADGVAAELRQRDPGRNVTFVAEPGLTAWGDPGLLKAALENLLSNAWKFTSKKPSAAITFGRLEHEGEPAFLVRDNGAGFEMFHADKLFGAFQRLHSEREFPGNGIGLATVQRIVRRHGGRIWAQARPQEGATFYFTLPFPGDGSSSV